MRRPGPDYDTSREIPGWQSPISRLGFLIGVSLARILDDSRTSGNIDPDKRLYKIKDVTVKNASKIY